MRTGSLAYAIESNSSDEVAAWLRGHPAEAECLAQFTKLMAKELAANNDKGNRPGWLTMDRPTAIAEVHWHASKLAVAAKDLEAGGDEAVEIASGSAAAREDAAEKVREYAADVGNTALMVLDSMGLLDGVRSSKPRTELAPHIHHGRESL